MSFVSAVCRVASLHPDDSPVGVTAIDKQAVAGPVMVRDLGLAGDVQADRQHHGGLDQAVYAFADEEAAFWSAELGADIHPGMFGENLRTRGIATDDAELGERWRVGDTVVLEVTGPRIPCTTFGRWLGQNSWPKRFTQHGRPGVYFRVVERGEIAAGDRITVVHRPGHGVTVARWFAANDPGDARTITEYEAGSTWAMPENLRGYVEQALTRL